MRVLVCGGRSFSDWDLLCRVLDAQHEKHRIGVIIHGAYRGADTLADSWAICRGVGRDKYPADWSFGKKAGPIRNQRMLDEGRPDLVLAFPGGRGTADMVARARNAGVEVVCISS